ncbi:Protein of unknown function [Streptomyces sp. DvalAA-14]|uniref:DUF2637 domain-containing protein n=1 Tax=unclassified Streptomyces TaxID=2593676 RepID=UPI00081B28A4|nr:DUF2637 domain-containing protein [Streptomyces sp. DvalAA-14]MYS21276.1 DUF2637 domain-containing protein [Streptomyces sp. SID4948]SCD88616.1 Protein of unknown function [Streptomyces sp. DvalAA-14]
MAAIRLTRTHRILVAIVITGAVIIAGIGFAGSYAAVRTLALHKGFGWFANVFPIGVDAGIVVLLALDLLLTWLRIPFPLLRQTAWLLTAATIAFNGAAAWPDPLGVGMHAIIPVLFVVSVEAARHAIGRIADITADKHMEGVRLTRWLLAPVPTFKLWRRMKLWELRSYEEVIRREQDRLVYRARLRARYGVGWRRKAPIEAIMPLRLAKYGVPLSETADAGLEAAGIEIGSPIRQLEAGFASDGEPAREEQAESAAAAAPIAPVAPAGLVKGAPGAAPAAAPVPEPESAPVPTHQQGYDPAFLQQQQAYEQQLFERRLFEQQQYEQQPPYEEAGQDVSPWFAAQQMQQAQAQAQSHPYYPQGQFESEPEPQAFRQQPQPQPQQVRQQQPQRQESLRVPAGPNRTRPLGAVGTNGANGTAQNGFNGRSAQEFREPPQAAQAAYPQQQYQQPAQPEPAADSADPAYPEIETYPVAGLQLPDGMPPSEAYFGVYRRHIQSTGEHPNNARVLARILENEFGGSAPEQRELIGAIRALRTRYQSEQETEHIP